jgi:hypothetical protein
MKLLIPNPSVPLWGKILGYICTSLAALAFVLINNYVAMVMFVFLNGIVWLSIKAVIKFDNWKKDTLAKDSFFQENNFSLASYSKFSMLAVSSTIVRIVTTNSNVQIKELRNRSHSKQLVHYKSFDISEIYKNYPSQRIDLTLNGKNLNYMDIPVSEIKSVQAILQGDATEYGFLSTSVKESSNFGIRITTKQDLMYDIDTQFSSEFCDEINSHLS